MIVKNGSYYNINNKLIDYRNKVYDNGKKRGCVQFGFPILKGYRKAACECSNNIIYENVYKDPYSKSSVDNELRYNQTIKKIQNKNGRINKEYNNSYKKYLYRRAKSYETRTVMEKKINHRVAFKKDKLAEKKEPTQHWNSCTNTYDISYCSKSNVILYNPSNKPYSTQGAVSGGEKINRLKYDTILWGQHNVPNSTINNLINGAYPISLYKNTHPINKKKEPDPCKLKTCYQNKSCIRFC